MTYTFDRHYQAVEFCDDLRRASIGYKRNDLMVTVADDHIAETASILRRACDGAAPDMNAYLISREDLSLASDALQGAGNRRIPLCGCASMEQASNIALLLARTLWIGFRVYVHAAGQDEPTVSYLR